MLNNILKILLLQIKRSFTFHLKFFEIIIKSVIGMNILFITVLTGLLWPDILTATFHYKYYVFVGFQAPAIIFLAVFGIRIFLIPRTNTKSYVLIPSVVPRNILVLYHIFLNLLNPFLFFEVIFSFVIGCRWIRCYTDNFILLCWFAGFFALICSLQLARLIFLQYFAVKNPFRTILVVFLYLAYLVFLILSPNIFKLSLEYTVLYFGINEIVMLVVLVPVTYLLIRRTFFLDFIISR